MWSIFSLFLLCLHQSVQGYSHPYVVINTTGTVYDIVGIFEPKAIIQIRSFNNSMPYANLDDKRLSPIILTTRRTDSYSVMKYLCSQEDLRPIVIFGPQNAIADSTIREQSAIANVPHLQAAWQPFDPDRPTEEEEGDDQESTGDETQAVDDTQGQKEEEEEEEEPVYKNISINFYPDANEIAIAFARLLKFYNWENFAVLYEDDYGLLRIQKILAEYTTSYPIFVKRLDPETDNHEVFKELKEYKESRVLLDCHVDRIEKYMSFMNNTLKIVNRYQHFMFVSLDASVHAHKLMNYPSNATWLSLTDFDALNDAQHFLASRVGEWNPEIISPPVTNFQLESLLMVDMANHVIESVIDVEKKYNLTELPRPTSDICDKQADPWQYGAILQQSILEKTTVGVTGNIQFNATGHRYNYTLYVNEKYFMERNTIGRWESLNPDEIIPEGDASNAAAARATNKHLIIISRRAKPYFYEKEPCVEGQEGQEDCDDKYEGFSVDLVKQIFKLLKEWNLDYSYEFVLEGNKTYGHYDQQTKKWDGLIGDLLDKKADLAVCDLTITEERKKVVDFSVPFMTLGISILYTKEQKISPGWFSFLNPYTIDVWMYTATAYCIVSMVLFFCARLSPADWENPQPCDKDPEELENIWNFKNCTWLTMGSIMTQGCDILPKAFGSRWICAMWWFFAVIVCQTYIAQLSASMTEALKNEPINSVDDLAKQNKILYGCIKGGSTMDFFKNSNDKMYQSIYQNMMANDAVLVDSNDEGEKRVMNSRNKYAFFMESTTIDYKMKRNCELKRVGNLLDSKDYGIAMPANSPFRSDINRAILKLKELTILDVIKNKWWDEKYGAIKGKCDEPVDVSDVEGDLEVENLIGLFVVLVAGLFVSLCITAAEFMDEVRNIVVREQVPHKEAFIKELKASLNFSQLQKPVLRNPSRAPSIASNIGDMLEERHNKRAKAMENFLDLEKMPQ